jgi:hypothetical protein
MLTISRRKEHYAVSPSLRAYLRQHGRATTLPIHYEDFLKPQDSYPLIDANGRDTLWQVFLFPQSVQKEINSALTRVYALLKAGGNLEVMDHLRVDRIDFCSFGNSRPLRIRIVNQYNDNYDYFYVKKADASRVYGLELEELLSPSSLNFLVDGDTLIEEHIVGIPGDVFITDHFSRPTLNRVRVAKEFIKFNERCFVRLLGDMRSYNYVVAITPDFEDEQYRVRPIDFDQQSYEGRHRIYLPQFFKDNVEVVKLCTGLLNPETILQYQNEERSLIARRASALPFRLQSLRHTMSGEFLAPITKIHQLRDELAQYHQNPRFKDCQTMGQIVFLHLDIMLKDHVVTKSRR